jgi:hypothetical protein
MTVVVVAAAVTGLVNDACTTGQCARSSSSSTVSLLTRTDAYRKHILLMLYTQASTKCTHFDAPPYKTGTVTPTTLLITLNTYSNTSSNSSSPHLSLLAGMTCACVIAKASASLTKGLSPFK